MLRLNSLLLSIIRHIRQAVPFTATTSVNFTQTYQLVVPSSRDQNGCGWSSTTAEFIQKGGRLNLLWGKMEGIWIEREGLERLQEVEILEETTRRGILELEREGLQVTRRATPRCLDDQLAAHVVFASML
jgi:hypothetical protein